MQDYSNTKIHIDKLFFMNGLIMKEIDAYINYNFLIMPGSTEDKTNWINLNCVQRMEGTEIIGE